MLVVYGVRGAGGMLVVALVVVLAVMLAVLPATPQLALMPVVTPMPPVRWPRVDQPWYASNVWPARACASVDTCWTWITMCRSHGNHARQGHNVPEGEDANNVDHEQIVDCSTVAPGVL